ncbi:MAG: helix-turn-helix domain-containing protein [Terrimicrobiaceae bacterium]
MKTLREAKGLKQGELAEQMAWAQSELSRVESGQKEPTADFVVVMAYALEIDVRDALVQAGKPVHEISFKETNPAALETDRLLSQIPDATERARTMNTVRAVIQTAIQNYKATQEKAEIEADRRELMALFDQLTEEEQNTLLWAARSQNTKGKGARGNEAKGSQDVVRGKPQKARQG